MNTLAHKLGLLDDDIKQENKLIRLCEDLRQKILTPVEGEIAWHYTEADLTLADALAANWESWSAFTNRTVWSKKQGHTWFAARVTVPESARGKTFVLRFSSQWQERPGSTDPQCLAYLDGKTAQAIDGNHTELVIARDAVPGTSRVLMVNAFTFFDRPLVGFKVEYLVRHEAAEKLYFDLQTPLEVAMCLTQTDGRRHAILNLVDQALHALDRRGAITPEFDASIPAAKAIADKIYAIVDTEAQPLISAVGHTHLDVGWLWRVMHTRDKTGRSFATILSLMEEYPDFVFMYNQSVLFNFLKQDYPDLWEGVMAKVRNGQFEIEGAMWVEPDVNIVSGESLVRQIMRGRKFHMKEFGVTPKVVWLPDTFGYSANLPQIMERSGLDYFVTSKLSWNDTDRHPYDTFFWRGIDGTKTKAQLITTQRHDSDAIFTTYNSDLSTSEVIGAWKRYEPKAANDEVLVCYGYGDGGGGPTRAMIERGLRFERGIPGAPRMKLEGIVPFLERLGPRMDADASRFPLWDGELYLELHRGTLTTIAKNKANNRQAERVLRETEFLQALAFATIPGSVYPHDTIEKFWETVLINQFHDILPGTSIPEVYVDSDAEYATLFSSLASANGLWVSAATQITGQKSGELKLLNFTGHERTALVALDLAQDQAGLALAANGTNLPLQRLERADGAIQLGALVSSIPSLGWTGAQLLATSAPKVETTLSVSEKHLENAKIRVTFDANGEILSIFDKQHEREVIASGQTANRLVAYEDKPMNWEAWDIERYFEQQPWPLAQTAAKITVVETGPYRAAIRVERTYLASKVIQIISLEDGARQIGFDTFIDWQERRTVLKVTFPLDLNTCDIRSEIQFGHVKRATHRNTTWDRARYEVSMHRWIDMSEANFGVALLNDCKYAYDAHDQTIRLTLLRSPNFPNPQADMGEHRIRYALMVHEGVSDLEVVPVAAEALNNAIAVLGALQPVSAASPAANASFSFAKVDCGNVTLETVKKAENSDHLVLRVFEHANVRTKATIAFGVNVKAVSLTNLMEEGEETIPVVDNKVVLSLRPFEIATLKITVA
jgi:alpha-mannosidase